MKKPLSGSKFEIPADISHVTQTLKKAGFDKIDIANWRTAKENLIKAVEIYGKRLYKQTDIKKVIQLNPNGYLPAEYQVKLVEILRNIYSILPRDEREKWNLPFQNNATAKKVAEWIGKDLTEDIKF